MAVGVVLVGLHRVIVSGVFERGPTSLTVTSAGFLGALVLTSVLSSQTWVAFTGLTVRGAGAITYGLCLALLHVGSLVILFAEMPPVRGTVSDLLKDFASDSKWLREHVPLRHPQLLANIKKPLPEDEQWKANTRCLSYLASE